MKNRVHKKNPTALGLYPEIAALVLAAFLVSVLSGVAKADDTLIERGEYLVRISGCGDCHTPGYFLGQPDDSKYLAGSDVGFEVPGLGTFYGPNLTPHPETGLGSWTEAEIVAAITTGVRPDGRQLAPVMPWMGYSNLMPQDAASIAAYLAALPPVAHAVPGPFGPGEVPSSFVMRIIPPGE